MAKKSKRKEASIKSSILVLLLILILLISSTYAWFTANKNITISTLNVNVTASNGIQISTDAEKWKTVITNEDITTNAYVGNTNQLPNSMAPVSTVKDVVDGKLQLFEGALAAGPSGNFQLTATGPLVDTQGPTGNYIAFDIFLKVNDTTEVYLSSGPEGSKVSDDKGLANAARVAFIDEGNAADGQEATTYTSLNTGNTGSTKIWEPNNEVHKAEAKSNATGILGVKGPVGDTELPTYGVAKAIESPIAADQTQKDDGTNLKKVTNDISTPSSGVPESKALIQLKPGITKVRIYMWIEGQDIDCENSSSGANVKFDVKFNIV